MAIYAFFIACIFGRQYVDAEKRDLPIYVYFLLWTVLQLLFYLGYGNVRYDM